MCGRFARATELEAILRRLRFDTSELTELHPRYNVAPGQAVAVVQVEDGRRVLASFRWGLIPSWAKDAKIAFSLINARAETVAEKPAFRAAFKSRRCLIPATAFYEWEKVGTKKKQPFAFAMRDGEVFAFAGLWERWNDIEAGLVQSCSIITTQANGVVRPVHDRMPVIVAPNDFAAWLDPQTGPVDLHGLLRPYPAAEMIGWPVSSYVSNARNEGPECLAP
jgi:putative SOS response-associated peptidase YedK